MPPRPLTLRQDIPVSALALSSTLGLVAVGQGGSAGDPASLSLWNLDSMGLRKTVPIPADQPIVALRFGSSGALWFVARDGWLGVVQPGGAPEVVLEEGLHGVVHIDVSHDERHLLICGEKTYVWDTHTKSVLWELEKYTGKGIAHNARLDPACQPEPDQQIGDYERWPAQAQFTVNENEFVACGFDRNEAAIFATSSQQPIALLACAPLQVTDLCYAAELHLLAVVGHVPRGVVVWELASKRRILEDLFTADYANITSVALHVQPRRIIVGALAGGILVHDLDSGEMIASHMLHAGPARHLCVDQARQMVVSGGDDGQVWITPIA